ncbi:hypothetical protein ACO1O0_007128 [Amphichorda felina]
MTDCKDISFATPLPQSPRSEILEWRFPKPYHNYVLTGRSRAAWHTSFVIPQLNLLLDAGLCVNRLRPKHIFLTHGHNDHILLSPAFVKREDPPDIYCPAAMKRAFNNFILADTMLNLGGVIAIDDAEAAGLDIGEGPPKHDPDDPGRTASEAAWLNTHHTHAVRDGDVVPLRRLKGITASVFDCDHTVPCVGYVFSATTHKLRPEYASLPGPELKRLRQEGADITAAHTTPMFAFLGDTTAATLAAAPWWLEKGIPVVITECSFLYDRHKQQADKTKHTAWCDLEKVVRRWPQTTFVLTHFSMRYSEREITAFFRDMPDCPPNIVVWSDPET